MSADNGVYILYTESELGSEYRVAYSNAIDNIYGACNDETGRFDGNEDSIREVFANSQVYFSIDEAFDYADLIAEDYEWLEDGVCLINKFSHLNPFRKSDD